MAPEQLLKIMQILYILAIIAVAQVDCQRRYRYETPKIKFELPTVVIPAPLASLNIPTGPVQQTVPIPATAYQPKFTASVRPILTESERPILKALERPILPLFIPPEPSKSLKDKPDQAVTFPQGLESVSPYYAEPGVPGGDLVIPPSPTDTKGSSVSPYYAEPGDPGVNLVVPPSPPNTTASDLTDDRIHLCPLNITDCDPSYPWRSFEGNCNNLANPHFGTVNQPMPRLLGANFDIGMVRIFGADGSLLPNPRAISIALNLPPRRSTNHNLLIMQIGQFVDHDQVLTSGVRGPNGTNRACKSCKSWTDPVCMPIPIPTDDPFFPSHSSNGERICLPFTRSVVSEGKFNTVDPINLNTAFLDLSTVYSSDRCQSDELRLFRYGLLRMGHVFDVPKGLPPAGFQGFEECRLKSKKCLHTGDPRSNEHLTLLMIHTIFLREHNRLAEKIALINKHWDDERIFQEARRINIAQYQHIIYQEYIPALIGFSKAREYRLQALDYGYSTGYSDKINPGIVNEFAGAAYRIGHSMVPEAFPKFSSEYQFSGEISLLESFHNPKGFGKPKEFDECIRGLLGTRLPALDLHFENVIKRHLFEKKDKPFSGEDLLARNIARGREFGFPGYINYVELCGVSSKIETWEDLHKLMDPFVVQYLQRVYRHPNDIDLFIGGMSEYQSPGALVGPTFSCIIANQFIGSKRGDRFWYENEGNGFTLQQLDSIRKTSRWARILCKNLNEISTVPYYSTIIPIKSSNPLVRCDHLEDLDISQWEEHHDETHTCKLRGKIYQVGEQISLSACSFCVCNTSGKVNCVAANVNCRSLSESDRLEESCQLMCGPQISYSVEPAEGIDVSYLEN